MSLSRQVSLVYKLMRKIQVHGLKQWSHAGLHKAPDTVGLVESLHGALGFWLAQERIGDCVQVLHTAFTICFFTKLWWSFMNLHLTDMNSTICAWPKWSKEKPILEQVLLPMLWTSILGTGASLNPLWSSPLISHSVLVPLGGWASP